MTNVKPFKEMFPIQNDLMWKDAKYRQNVSKLTLWWSNTPSYRVHKTKTEKTGTFNIVVIYQAAHFKPLKLISVSS